MHRNSSELEVLYRLRVSVNCQLFVYFADCHIIWGLKLSKIKVSCLFTQFFVSIWIVRSIFVPWAHSMPHMAIFSHSCWFHILVYYQYYQLCNISTSILVCMSVCNLQNSLGTLLYVWHYTGPDTHWSSSTTSSL